MSTPAYVIVKDDVKSARVRVGGNGYPSYMLPLLAGIVRRNQEMDSTLKFLLKHSELEFIKEGNQIKKDDFRYEYDFECFTGKINQVVDNFENYKDLLKDTESYSEGGRIYTIDTQQKTLTVMEGIEGEPEALYGQHCDGCLSGYDLVDDNIEIEEAIQAIRNEGYLIGSIY